MQYALPLLISPHFFGENEAISSHSISLEQGYADGLFFSLFLTDIPDIEVVVNYDLPNTIDDYVHRGPALPRHRAGGDGSMGRWTSHWIRHANRPICSVRWLGALF